MTKVVVKIAQEESIQHLMKDLVDRREEGRIIVEEVPVGSKGSNGIIKRAVQEVEHLIGRLVLALQQRLGLKLDAKERIVAFMPDYAAYLSNKLIKRDMARLRMRGSKARGLPK